MSDTVAVALLTAFVNGAVTWGVVTTKLAWLRHDIDMAVDRIKILEARRA